MWNVDQIKFGNNFTIWMSSQKIHSLMTAMSVRNPQALNECNVWSTLLWPIACIMQFAKFFIFAQSKVVRFGWLFLMFWIVWLQEMMQAQKVLKQKSDSWQIEVLWRKSVLKCNGAIFIRMSTFCRWNDFLKNAWFALSGKWMVKICKECFSGIDQLLFSLEKNERKVQFWACSDSG